MDADINNDFSGGVYQEFLEKLNKPWTHSIKTDDELKQLVKDFFENKVFSNFHMQDQHMISHVFMPILFLGHLDWPNRQTRSGKLFYIFNEHKEIEYNERFKKWLSNIGLVYEYYGTNISPTSVNGMPIFYSCNILSLEDTKRFWGFYEKYEKLQKNLLENF